MKNTSKKRDKSVGKVLKLVTENRIDRLPEKVKHVPIKMQVIDAGKCLMSANQMRNAFYE